MRLDPLARQYPALRTIVSDPLPSHRAPSGHAEHLSAPPLKNPTRHVQSLAAADPVPTVVPPSPTTPMQSVQATESPFRSLNVP